MRAGFAEAEPSTSSRTACGSKSSAIPRALIVGHANGMVGCVPTPEAFRRGGYETTFLSSIRLAPKAGDILAEVAVDIMRRETEAGSKE